SSLMGTKNSVDNEVEVLKTTDLMREMVLAEKAYISYFNKGTVHNVPVSAAPFRVATLTNPDSISSSYIFEVNPVTDTEIELSNPDTVIRINWGEPFVLPSVGILKMEKAADFSSKENFGFRIAPLRSVAASFSSRLSVEVTNKNVSTIDLTLEHTLPKRGE